MFKAKSLTYKNFISSIESLGLLEDLKMNLWIILFLMNFNDFIHILSEKDRLFFLK